MSFAAADRIRRALADAEKGDYLTNGWYSYISRRDVETVVEEYLRLVDGPLTSESGRAQDPASGTSRFSPCS